MANTPTDYLKVYTEESPEVLPNEPPVVESLPELLAAFKQATGWSLEHIPGPKANQRSSLTWSTPDSPGVGASLGHLSLERSGSTPAADEVATIDRTAAERLARSLDGMFQELAETETALRQREAELAANVPPVLGHDEGSMLAERLEADLRGGAEAVGAHAAALYLLDDDTRELKLRSCWGLPRGRLRRPPRQLAGELADLEAMLGHAVVLEDTAAMPRWNVPEDFPAAVCVPVSSPTTILGTLWIFSRQKRDFTEQQTNVLEIVAGRVAADLEREMLLGERHGGVYWKHQIAAAEQTQRGAMPTLSPLLDGWQTAGWAAQADRLGGGFFDWFCLPEGFLAIALGDTFQRGIEGALAAGAVKATARAHAQSHCKPEQLLARTNLALWTMSAGDQSANLLFGYVETASGAVHFATAGHMNVVALRPGGWQSLSQPSAPLGGSPETQYQPQHYDLQPGESLAVFSDGFRDALDAQGRPLGEAGLAEKLVPHALASADQIVRAARECLQAHAVAPGKMDRAILVVRRTP